MKAHLMYKDRDFDLKQPPVPQHRALTQDLELNTLFGAMAAGDDFLRAVSRTAVLTSLSAPAAMRYRQDILADCLVRSDIVRQMYALALEAIERERKVWGSRLSRYPAGVLHRSIEVLTQFVELLKSLKHIADEHGAKFRSEGFSVLFAMLARELDEAYLRSVEDHLRRLAFRDGVVMSADLGKGEMPMDYVLHKPRDTRSWLEQLQGWVEGIPHKEPSSYVYQIADRDESGLNALSELRSQGISGVATALAQATDHVLSFFTMLRAELGFYIGCLNLRDRLIQKGEPICFPEPLASGPHLLSGKGLYDVCLSLSVMPRAVGNDVGADGKLLVMITGANRGGKSTFLRGVGQAQLMMQCGMFVAAESFRANVCAGIFSHFKREEDASMRSGKLDEELGRMSAIVDQLKPNSIVLLNESFASTNQREAAEIARQIVRALLESGIKVVYVTHLFDLAHQFYLAQMNTALFLRAERLDDGRRTFRLVEGEPLPTSYGEDLYRRIFSVGPHTAAAAPRV
jgi:hypothetical protein